MNWRQVINGIVGAAINNAVNTPMLMTLAPDTFNLHEGLPKLGIAVGFSAVMGALMWLKQHPLPEA